MRYVKRGALLAYVCFLTSIPGIYTTPRWPHFRLFPCTPDMYETRLPRSLILLHIK